MIMISEEQLKELLEQQRKICADKAIAHEWNQSSEALDILHNVVKNVQEPNWQELFEQEETE